jgi:hypothetical protein
LEGGWLALLVISIIVFRPISFSYRAFSELRLLKLGGLEPYGPALYRGIDAAICLAYGGTAFTVDAVIGSCLWAILWIAYLRRSKRVANSYGAVTFTSLA